MAVTVPRGFSVVFVVEILSDDRFFLVMLCASFLCIIAFNCLYGHHYCRVMCQRRNAGTISRVVINLQIESQWSPSTIIHSFHGRICIFGPSYMIQTPYNERRQLGTAARDDHKSEKMITF